MASGERFRYIRAFPSIPARHDLSRRVDANWIAGLVVRGIVDMDEFKSINDNYGHLTGDLVLQGTAEVLRRTVRDTDIAARWGGEEFLVVLPNTPKEGAWTAAEKVREALGKQLFHDEDGNPVAKVTLSGGVATFPEDGCQQTELVAAADRALYEAKETGRNKVLKSKPRFFSASGEEPIAGNGSAA